MEREVGGGIGMGNTCKPLAVSFQCMTKSTTNKKKKKEYWGVLSLPSPGYLPNPMINSKSLTLQADSLLSEPRGKPQKQER